MTSSISHGHVLVVDDDESNRESLSRRLARRGYTASVAIDGPTALLHLQDQPCDLVLLDIMMPGMSGLEVLEIIRKTRPAERLPVIMATARDQSTDVVRALELGANDYVTKPLDFAVVAARVRTHLALKHAVDRIADLEQRLALRNEELEAASAQTQRELKMAARVQEAFLPKANASFPGVKFEWLFEPCQELAGDSFNICPLGNDLIGFYVLDVTGHGVASSLLAVAATRALSPGAAPDSMLMQAPTDGSPPAASPPADVAARLSRWFGWNEDTGQFLTLFYALLNTKTREFTYVSAGHPPAIHLSAGGQAKVLEGSGLPIGVGEEYEQFTVTLAPGDRVYLYSDGVTEAMTPDGTLLGQKKLLTIVEGLAKTELAPSLNTILAHLHEWRAGAASNDDITLLAAQIG